MSNKIRNRFIALVCLAVFIALGVLFYSNWVVQKPFAVILFITDNLTPSQLTPARIYQGGADHRLNLEKFAHLALTTTQANDFSVPDAAAAATAIATGKKVNNRALAVDAGSNPLPTLLEAAKKRGRSIGLISNASLTDATPAAFYAKSADPLDHEGIALQLSEKADIDVLLGGGEADFLPDIKDGRRKDGRDLILEMRHRGYDIARNRSELENTPLWKAPKILGLFAPGNLAFTDEIKSSSPQPSLAELVRQAIQMLQFNNKGYLLVVDAGLVGKAAQQNEGERMLREMLTLDEAVAVARQYAGEKALIIVTGKQSLGGLRLNGFPFRSDRGIAITGINAQGVPSLTWSTGPGSRETMTEDVVTVGEPAAFKTQAGIGVAEDTMTVSEGPGSEKLQGFIDNTDIFKAVEKGL